MTNRNPSLQAFLTGSVIKPGPIIDTAVPGPYCDYLIWKKHSTADMLGAISRQLLERDWIPRPIRQAFLY